MGLGLGLGIGIELGLGLVTQALTCAAMRAAHSSVAASTWLGSG